MKKVITRFPPSPTGEIHIGNMRTMLFNYLYAKHFNGEIFLRFEDTDKERSKKEFEPIVIDGLTTLGLKFDYGPFRQSERGQIYKNKLIDLIKSGGAYEAEDSLVVSGKVIRFRNPNKIISFEDKVRGNVSIDSKIFGDFVIARNIDNPIYHFAVVVDDMEMGITHIIRGEDHITSTPRQILLLEALGGNIPVYAHLPLIVGEDKKKLSKRHGSTSVSNFLNDGYLPEALVNYLAFLGWNPGGEREIYSLRELVKIFDLDRVGKNSAMFDYKKLDSINRHYMSCLSFFKYRENLLKFVDTNYYQLLNDNSTLVSNLINEIVKPRINKFSDIRTMISNGELEYFFKSPSIDMKSICFKDRSVEETFSCLASVGDELRGISSELWNKETIKETLSPLLKKYGVGTVLHPLRYCLSGKIQSPDPYVISFTLGKDETLSRIHTCLENKF